MTHKNNAARNIFSDVVATLMYTLSCLTLQPPRTASSYPVTGGRQCSISSHNVRTHARLSRVCPRIVARLEQLLQALKGRPRNLGGPLHPLPPTALVRLQILRLRILHIDADDRRSSRPGHCHKLPVAYVRHVM
jgi:hypothetical protein